MRSTSGCESGTGFAPAPTNPVTPGVPFDDPRLVGHVHVHEDVARKHALLGLHLLAVLRLDDLLGRDDHPAERRLLVQRDDAVLEIRLDLVLVSRVGVDDVPEKHQRLLEKNAVDEGTDDLVEAPEVEADDRARDDHDDDTLERLAPRRPVDLRRLGVRLADELPALLLGLPTGLLLDGLLGRPNLLRARTARVDAPSAAARAGGATLSAGLACHLAGLPMHRVLGAPTAVLLELHPVG